VGVGWGGGVGVVARGVRCVRGGRGGGLRGVEKREEGGGKFGG